MSRHCLIALALGGCDSVLGLEMVTAPPPEVVGTFRARTVVNDSNFEPMRVERVMAAANLSFRAVLDDGSEPEVIYNEESGRFRFVVPELGTPYRLSWLADGVPGEIQHDVAELSVGTTFAGRPDASPLVRSEVSFNYPMAPVRTAHIVSTGIYTQTDTGLIGPVVEFDWRLANPLSTSGTRMLDADGFDRVYALEPETVTGQANSPPWTRYRAVSSASITQAAATSAMLPSLQAVEPNSCVRLVVNGTAEHLRIKSAHPRNYFQESQNWITYAVPAPEYVGLSGLISTASCGIATPSSTTFDFDVTPAFYDPFLGATLVASSSAVATYYVQLPPAAASPVSNSTTVRIPIERGDPKNCAPAVTTITPTIAIPGKFLLDGIGLSFDNQSIQVDTLRAPTLEWQKLTDGPTDVWTVSLQEVESISNKTAIVPRWGTSTPYPRARIESKFLLPGHTYIFAVTAATGRPSFIDGDLMTLTMPIETATIYSNTFTVAPL